jgi:quercetin dioxygenase-like cupin family protein
MTKYVRKKDSREISEVAAGQGTSMQILIGSEEAPNFAFRKFVMEPNGGMPKHTNLVEHEQYVLSGSGIIEIVE